MNGNNKPEIRIERIFDAPVDILWQIWTDPALLMRWHGSDPDGTGISASVDLQVGGRQEVRFRDSNGSEHHFFGEFKIISPGERLAFTFEWASEPGHITLVDARFFDLGEKTKLILSHSNLSPTSEHTYETGWNGAFNKIERLVFESAD